MEVNYGILSVIPPLVAIILCFATQQALISMFAGLFVGALIICNYNPLSAVAYSLDSIAANMTENINQITAQAVANTDKYLSPMMARALSDGPMRKTEIEYQQLTKKLKNDPINLQKDNPELYEGYKLYYENENYTMIIEPMQEGKGYSKYDGTITIEPKCKVTIRKSNGEESSSIEYLPGFTEYEDTIEVLSDGYIVFKSLDEETYGWYDSYGNKVSLPSGYEIKDIINNIIIVYKYNEESNSTEYYFLDSLGRILLKTYDSLKILENIYIVKNENNKMLLYDENLNKISNEYDLIIF